MSARRRAAVLAGGLLAVVASIGPVADANAQSSWWAGRWDDGQKDGATFTGDSATFSGTFVYARGEPWYISRVDFELVRTGGGGDEAACPSYTAFENFPYEESTAPTSPDPSDPSIPPPDGDVEEPSSQKFRFVAAPRCNGLYTASARATADFGDSGAANDESDPITLRDIVVAIAPPPVTGFEASAAADRSVSLSWQPPAGYGAPTAGAETTTGAPPDFVGYVVERAIGNGAFAAVTGVNPDVRSYVDKAVPADATSVRYRIMAVRYGADRTPQSLVYSSDGPTTTITLAGATTTAPPPGGGGGGARGGGAIGGGRATTTTEFDPGFGEFLPYDESGGDVEPGAGEEETELGADEAAGSVLQQFSDDPLSAGSLAAPIGIGMVMFVWAMHIRFITRQAARALPAVPVQAAPVRARGRHYRR